MLLRRNPIEMAKPMWNLSIYITSLSTEKSVEVNGETHVGTLMLNLVEGLGKFFLVHLIGFTKSILVVH